MILDHESYPNRRDVSCEIIRRPLPSPCDGVHQNSAALAAATLRAIATSSRQDWRRSTPAYCQRRWGAPTPQRKGPSRTIAPALTFAAFMLVATTTVAARAAIVSITPATAVVYAWLGMPVNLRGLSIDLVRATAEQQTEDSRELLVTGEIVNLRDSETPVPNLRLAVRAEDGQELYVWTARGPKDRLGARERVAFRARLASPPPGVRDVLVKFDAPRDKASFTETHS
jgi:hypothetical protein